MDSLKTWLQAEPFTLALSSGFFGFYAHTGVLASLEEHGLRPNHLSGASAGALAAAGWASGLEARDLKELIYPLRRSDFWDPGLGLGFLKGQKFRRLLRRHFVSQFSQTRIPLDVAVFDLFARRTRFLEQGDLVEAVVASCAVPVMFHPVRQGFRLYWDGGIFNKAGVNPRKTKNRTLCIYLESQGVSGVYERRLDRLPSRDNLRILRLGGLPRVNPNRLHEGPAALEAAYKMMDRHLEESLDSK